MRVSQTYYLTNRFYNHMILIIFIYIGMWKRARSWDKNRHDFNMTVCLSSF